MWAMSEPNHEASEYFKRIPQTEYYVEEHVATTSFLNVMPEFRILESHELVAGSKSGLTFRTVTIDTPNYLPYLVRHFEKKGGVVIRRSIQHISQVINGAYLPDNTPPDAVVVCAGIGARRLGGVEDKDVHPIRGQTVLLRAPWVDFGKTLSSDSVWTYIIPRRSGDVIVGGTRDIDDWHPHPRAETTKDILTRVLAISPELAPPEVRAERKPTVADLEAIIIETGCGLRPGRKGGIRLGAERVKAASGKLIPVVFNYGHSGYGYQSSWGSASVAVEILQAELAKP
jgi:D-aspartate oxidase